MHAAAIFHDAPHDLFHRFFHDEFLSIRESDDRIGRLLHRLYYFGVEDEFPFFVRLRLELCQLDHSPTLSPQKAGHETRPCFL